VTIPSRVGITTGWVIVGSSAIGMKCFRHFTAQGQRKVKKKPHKKPPKFHPLISFSLYLLLLFQTTTIQLKTSPSFPQLQLSTSSWPSAIHQIKFNTRAKQSQSNATKGQEVM